MNRIFFGWLFGRSVSLWFLVRLTLAVLGAVVGKGATWMPDVLVEPSSAAVAVLVVVGLTLFEARRQNELLLLADLGIHPVAVLATTLLGPVLLELVLALCL